MEWVSRTLYEMLYWVEGFARTPHGTWALFALAFAEASVLPIPPDILLIALSLGEPSLAFWFATVCTVASVLGGTFGYGLGYWGGRPLLARFFAEKRIEAVRALYDRWSGWATGVAGLTPLPYKLFTVSGGAFAVDFRTFVLAATLSRGLRFFVVAGLIFWFGDSVKAAIEAYLSVLSIAFVLLLGLGFWGVRRFVRRRVSVEARDG